MSRAEWVVQMPGGRKAGKGRIGWWEGDNAWKRGREHLLAAGGKAKKKKGRKGIRAKVSSISQICPGSLQANLLSGCTSLNSF